MVELVDSPTVSQSIVVVAVAIVAFPWVSKKKPHVNNVTSSKSKSMLIKRNLNGLIEHFFYCFGCIELKMRLDYPITCVLEKMRSNQVSTSQIIMSWFKRGNLTRNWIVVVVVVAVVFLVFGVSVEFFQPTLIYFVVQHPECQTQWPCYRHLFRSHYC